MAKELLHDVTNTDPNTLTKTTISEKMTDETARAPCKMDEEREMTEEVMDTDDQQPDININNTLLGVTNPRNVVTVALHGGNRPECNGPQLLSSLGRNFVHTAGLLCNHRGRG